jgi:CelD/BcsL family acetyltransferase involved in cellulose biosynthesis
VRTCFTIETASDWEAVSTRWEGARTPFQDPVWLATWYASFRNLPGLTPLLLTVRARETGEVALRLPLVLHRNGRLRTITFADFGLTDYNAPLLGPAAPRDAATMRMLWREILKALPAADLIRLDKMPARLGDRDNPFTLLARAAPSAVNGNVVKIGDDWNLWRHSLEKTVRKELERSWRVFARHDGACFEIASHPAAAQRFVTAMEAQQAARMQAIGADYSLDDPTIAAFYRCLIDQGLASGYAVVTALVVGDEIVASLLGIRDGHSYVMIRISNAGGDWTSCSPGRLVIERTMAALHADGCRNFDFSVGNYDYKRRFNVAAVPLVNVTASLGWRGTAASWRANLAGRLRLYPELDRTLRSIARRLSTARKLHLQFSPSGTSRPLQRHRD